MSHRKEGQGAALAVVPVPPTRTPERQALADAIERREYVKALIAERRVLHREIEVSAYPYYDRRRQAEERKQGLPRDDRDRLNLLLARRDPDARTEREEIEAELAEINSKVDAIREQGYRAEADIHLLEEDLRSRERDVNDCVTLVVASDPVVPVVAAETEALLKRLATLRRACGSALNASPIGQPPPHHARLGSLIVPPEGPCPWDEVKRRLVNDPDAAFPMPEDV